VEVSLSATPPTYRLGWPGLLRRLGLVADEPVVAPPLSVAPYKTACIHRAAVSFMPCRDVVYLEKYKYNESGRRAQTSAKVVHVVGLLIYCGMNYFTECSGRV